MLLSRSSEILSTDCGMIWYSEIFLVGKFYIFTMTIINSCNISRFVSIICFWICTSCYSLSTSSVSIRFWSINSESSEDNLIQSIWLLRTFNHLFSNPDNVKILSNILDIWLLLSANFAKEIGSFAQLIFVKWLLERPKLRKEFGNSTLSRFVNWL